MDSNVEELSVERLREIKERINSILKKSNTFDSIRDVVKSYLQSNTCEKNLSNCKSEIIEVLKERGVLANIINGIRESSNARSSILQNMQSINYKSSNSIDMNKTYLHVKVMRGRAFLDNVSINELEYKNYAIYCAIHFGEQRVQSIMVDLSSNPVFDEDFVLELKHTNLAYNTEHIIEINTPLHIAIFRENVNMNTATLLGENVIDWRKTLRTGHLDLSVELCGRNSGIPTGVIDLQLEILSDKFICESDEAIASCVEAYRDTITTLDREFLIYTRRWWSEFQSIRSTHAERKIKLFASMPNGRVVPVTHFVSSLQSGQLLYSPYDAARFVSLFSTSDNDSVEREEMLQWSCEYNDNNNNSKWKSTFCFLNERQGGICNHALLLCSLLLGFALDAYCAVGIGKKSNTTTMYVLTRIKEHDNKFNVILWNAVTGQHFSIDDNNEYETIDCVFNHRVFYGNIQLSDSVFSASYDFENENFWKAINPLKLRMVVRMPTSPILCNRSTCNPLTDEIRLEMELRAELLAERDSFGAVTTFDENLSYCITQTLEEYERQRRGKYRDEELLFEICVKALLGPGVTFRAIPVNVSCLSSSYIFSVIKGTPTGKQIIETFADDVRYALRVRIFIFPEGVVSVWAVLGVAYNVLHLQEENEPVNGM